MMRRRLTAFRVRLGWKVKEFLKGRRSAPRPLVTVGIPIYDRVELLKASIDSILSQTFQDFELILVCDGSPPETRRVVEAYQQDPRVRIFSYPDNSGNAVRGRNKAILEARGLYYAFHDSDDLAEPDRLERSLRAIRRHRADVVYGGWRAKIEQPRDGLDLRDGQEVFSPDLTYQSLSEVCIPCQSTVMARTAVLRSAGALKPSMRYMEDYELWLRLAARGYRFKAIRAVLTTLRLHASNLELSFRGDDERWREKLLEEHRVLPAWKPKIAYLIPGTGISGGLAVICQHANRLMARGFDVILIDTLDTKTRIDWFPEQKVPVIPWSDAPQNLGIAIATGWQTVDFLLRTPADRKIYFVQSDETRFTEDRATKRRIRRTYQFDFEFMTEARWIQRWLKADFGHDALYVPNGLDERLFQPGEPLEPRSSRPRVLLEGAICLPFKGMKEAFAAVAPLDCEVWCVSGAGRPEADWRCDRFFERVPMQEMPRIYASCDILLKMSRVEGFFGPPLEMMACGGTVVVSKVTGYDEYIRAGENALVVESGDIEGAREAVRRLIEDSTLRARLARAGQATAAEWRWEPTVDVLEAWFSGRSIEEIERGTIYS